jgi:hypothetical protein
VIPDILAISSNGGSKYDVSTRDMEQERQISDEQMNELAKSGYLFAILDACIDRQIVQKAKQCGPAAARSLFDGTQLQDYYAVAPYIFHIDTVLLD